MNSRGEKREQILLGALDIFSRDGFHRAKVIDIANAADVGKGTIYEYFNSKKQLFEEMIIYSLEENLRRIDKVLQNEEDVKNKLKKYIYIEKEFLEKCGFLFTLVSQEINKLSNEVKNEIFKLRNNKNKKLEEIFNQGIYRNIFKEIDVTLISILFIGGVNQIVINSPGYCNENTKEMDVEDFLDLFINRIEK